jgi:hypothetical protein
VTAFLQSLDLIRKFVALTFVLLVAAPILVERFRCVGDEIFIERDSEYTDEFTESFVFANVGRVLEREVFVPVGVEDFPAAGRFWERRDLAAGFAVVERSGEDLRRRVRASRVPICCPIRTIWPARSRSKLTRLDPANKTPVEPRPKAPSSAPLLNGRGTS